MYYDMSGFDYGILDVVQVLHLRKRRGNYYDCPFCGETHGKLNINVEKNVFRCNRCDSSGGMLKLYADLHNVTLSEANQQIREALGKGEYRTDYIKATPVQEEKATAELAPIEEIHRTYQRMLSMLTLNRKHQEDLQRRGLKPEQIEAQRYRSVPLFGMKKLVKRLAEEGYMVKGVPGFYRDTDGNWTINFKAENSGILIPIVSLDGFIQGFQIRVDHVTDTKKYIWQPRKPFLREFPPEQLCMRRSSWQNVRKIKEKPSLCSCRITETDTIPQLCLPNKREQPQILK